ncbi:MULTISPECIES: type VI secretion system protein [unclassified Variovorax]|uniref:type VI secretion system protein n=1 Tax=unclassified Variovorax TaxID=663243 RepID=UPI003F4744CC
MLTDQLFLFSIAVLTLVVLLVLGMVLYFAARRSHAKPSSDPKVARIRFDSLRSSFRQAVELIEGNIASRADRYGIPWIMLLNEGDDHRQLPIEQSGVASALSTESASAAATQGISWHFFDRGVVIDIQGAYLGSPDDDDASEKPWDEFLGMCRAYRPQRPFDSVVITIPAALLLDDSTDGRLELSKRAKLAHRRLWLAQNRFAMRFAVYVLVTGAEQLEGFSAFARALPEPLRASMLGWSSPYDLSTTYQPGWVDEAVGTLVRTVSDVSAELFATDTAPQGAGPQLLLPSRIETLRGQLQLYVDELMRPSAYHEPFFFRGIYLTGDSGESAQAIATIDAERDTYGRQEPGSGDLIAQLMRQPAFLRDLFEKKIFLEYGLTRPSRTQTLARPVLHRALRWTAIVFLCGWGIGLVVATWQLHRHNGTLVSALSQLQHDAQYRMRAQQRGEPVPSAWYRNKALSLLAMNERLRTDGTYSFFMPGSWQVFDDLNERVIERIEREFGDIAVGTLRRELMARVSQLSGVEQDEATGEFIVGASCGLPPSFRTLGDAPRKNGLLVEDQPEFGALQRYLGSAEQLDTALQAVERLRQPSTGNAEDLRVAVRYALGAELPADLGRNLRYFRQAAEGRALSIPLAPVQAALRCALDKGTAQLDTRLFVGNELLVSEQALARLLPSLAGGGTFARTTASYREVIAAIKDQEDLVASGKGGWMRQPVLVLGASYDRTIARIEQNRLLGQEPADAVRARAQDAFQKFRAEFNLRFGGAQPGLVWQDKEGRFALASERIALRDALTALLAQPFMAAARDRDLPGAPGGNLRSAASWDLARLDQALAIGDVRKRYMTEGMLAFPPAVRPGIESALNAHFAQLVVDQVAEAATGAGDGLRAASGALTATDTQAAAYEASRQRLAKVQALLYEMGAGARADDLRAMMSRDALQRLEGVDEAFTQSELYAMRGRDFQGWRGERGPMLAAFGVSDAGSLAAYLGQQFSRTETLGKLADSYTAALDGAGAGSVLAQRWQAINRDLERYRLKNPNSSLLLLEQFLGTTGAEIDRDTCAAKLAGKAPAARIGDYFADRHQQIYSALLARCYELQFGDQQELWTQFSTRFNRSLAGRHPFGAATGRAFDLAEPADVNDLARAFDPLARALKESRTEGGPRTAAMPGAAARRFAEQFGRARDFLLPLFPTEDGAVPGYDLSVDFRVNMPAEIEGNKIIDWSLEVGDQVLRQRDAPRTLRWEYGMPVALVLRIAKDSPLVARADAQQPALLTDGQTVSFRFADPWALFTLAQRQREGDAGQRPDGRSQLLKFEFPLVAQSAGDTAQMPAGGRARVFLRLAASPAGKKTALVWPAAFPTRAPEWNTP